MTATPTTPTSTMTGWLRREDCHLEDLTAILVERTDLADYPHARAVEQGVLVYDAKGLAPVVAGREGRRDVQAEIARALLDGPGITVFTDAFEESVVDRVSEAFGRIIAAQRASGTQAGDHFAKPGANDRVWNALEKLAVEDPEAFVDYYATDVVDLVATAWLGPGYQVTSQVNVVNPGGAGQTVHRDYHLGFMDPDLSASYPAHVHALSALLTLQGAVAHVDMPLESGPTLYLPHSQKYSHGYLAYWLAEFQDYFVEHHIQLPLRKGDAVFFNPALFHAAGTNTSTGIARMANLLQVSSAFGRAMETIDRARVTESVYPVLMSRKASGAPLGDLANAVAASAEGYPFPSNLDRDQPVDGMAPPTQAQVVREALPEGLSPHELSNRLGIQATHKLSH